MDHGAGWAKSWQERDAQASPGVARVGYCVGVAMLVSAAADDEGSTEQAPTERAQNGFLRPRA